MPGSYKSTQRTGPRVVKTYQERLAGMKQNRTYSKPITASARARGPRDTRTGGTQTFSPQSKPRKTKTYAEQLQALQPPKQQQQGRAQQGARGLRPSTGPVRRSTDSNQLANEARLSMEYYGWY